MLLRHQLLTMEELLLVVLLVVPLRIVPQYTKHVNIAGVLEIVVVAMEKDISLMAMVAMKTAVLAVTALVVVASAEAQVDYRINNNIKLKNIKNYEKVTNGFGYASSRSIVCECANVLLQISLFCR